MKKSHCWTHAVSSITSSAYLRQSMKSVADFLAANRCAGRLLIATTTAETSATVMTMIVALDADLPFGF